MADQILTDAEVFGSDELLSDADVFGADKVARRGGTRAESKPFVAPTEDENARRSFAQTDPRRVDIAKTPGQLLEQPNAMDISGRLQAEREQLSQSPEAIERTRQQALYDARASRAPQEAKPLETTNRLTSDLRESVSNPAARGVVAGLAGLGKVGTGAVRLAADVVGAEDVAKFAAGAEGRATATERGATQDLKGNDKLVADVFASITNSAPSLAMGGVGGPAMRTLFAQSALSEYGAGRDAGFDVGESATRAGIMGAAEALGERFGFGEQVKLLKSVAKQLPTGELAKVFGSMLTKEIPGEQLTTAMQFMADKFGPAALNPNGSIDQYLEAAGETLKVTIGQTLLMGGGPAAAGAVRNEFQRVDAQRGNPIADFLTPKAKPDQPVLPPSQARAASIDRFGELAAGFGLPEKALAKAREAAANMPSGDVPQFLAKLADAYNRRGMFAKPLEPAAITELQTAIDGPPEAPPADATKTEAVAAIERVLKAAGALPDDALQMPEVLADATPEKPVDAVWLSAESDIPVKVVGPAQAGPDGREYTPVIGPDGAQSFLPADELIEADAKAPNGQQQSELPSTAAVAAGAADGGSAAGARSGGDQRPDPAVDGRADGAAAAPVPGSGAPGAVGDGGASDAALSAPSGAVMPAGLNVTFGGKTYAVDSVQDAQRKWIKFQESADGGGPAGVSQVGNGIPIKDGAGRLVARVAYNGRVFDPQDNVIAEVPGAKDAPAVRQLGSYGRTPNAATPVELRPNADGTLTPYTGKYPMVDYETGDPISIPADATDAEAVDAIRAAKAIVPKDKFFGIKGDAKPAAQVATVAPSTAAPDTEAVQADAEAPAPTRDEQIAAARKRIDGLKALLACLGK